MGPGATSAAPSALVASAPTSAPGTATALASGPPPPQANGGYSLRRRKGKTSGGSGPPNPGGARGAPGGARGQATPPQGSWPNLYNPWTGSIQMWPGPVQGHRHPTSHQALMGVPPSALGPPPPTPTGWAPFSWPTANTPAWPTPVPAAPWAVQQASPTQQQVAPGPFGPWDQHALAGAFNTMTLTPPTGEWYMDSGATAHMASTSGILTYCHPPSSSTPSSIIVGNGTSLPVVSTGSTLMGPIHLNNVLVSPSIIKNLVSVCQFTIDNNCSVEFDPAGFSVKDLRTRSVIARCNSSDDLYPLSIPLSSTTTPKSSSPAHLHSCGIAVLVTSATTPFVI
jgi:hypothetical protein